MTQVARSKNKVAEGENTIEDFSVPKSVLKIAKRLSITGFLILIVGCSTAAVTNIIPSNTQTIDTPDTGVTVSGTLGSTLVAKGFKTTHQGVEVTASGCVGGCTAVLRCDYREVLPNQRAPLNQQLPGNKRKSGGDALCAVVKMRYVAPGNCGGGEHLWLLCKDGDRWFSPDGMGRNEFDVSAGLKEVEIVDVNRPSFIQEFIYNGRYEDNLKFIYREFSDDLARPAFTQEVQYDLGAGNQIGFKNLLIEVVDATNTNISYKVIQSF